jgi:hypothetical protein
MRKTLLLLVLITAVAACANPRGMEALDKEYDLFAYEQEKYRREELQKLYEEERKRSDELTEKILALRKEIEEKERELEEIEGRRNGR